MSAPLHPIPGFTETHRLSGVAPFPLMAELGIGAVASEQSPLMKWELLRRYHQEHGITSEPKTEADFVASLKTMGGEQLEAFAESLRQADQLGVLSETGKRQLVLTEQELAYRAGEGAEPEPEDVPYGPPPPPEQYGPPPPPESAQARPKRGAGGILLLGGIIAAVAVVAVATKG